MVLQIVYVFYQISKHDSTRDYLIRETGNGNNQTICFVFINYYNIKLVFCTEDR